MKKSLLTLLSLTSLIAFSLTSCQKESVGTTTFEATLEDCQDDDSKTAFTNGTMLWSTDDQIKVFGTAGSGVYQATVRNNGRATFHCVSGDAGSAPYRAVYPASAANDDGTVELPVVQVTTDGSLTGFPMYAQGSSTNLDFKNLCGVLRLRLKKSGVSITAIEVTGDIELSGDFTVNYNGGNPSLTYSGHGTKTTILTCSTPQNITSQKDFYIFLPVHTYSAGMRIRIYSSDGGVCTKTVTAGHSVDIQRGTITTIKLINTNSLTFTPNAGTLPGLFTIDDQGHQVRFSQGNMQYTTLGTHVVGTGGIEKGTWRFASEQYEFIGDDNDNISSIYTKWIDLFGWGTSGWNSGAICYQPWSFSTRDSDYDIGGSYTNDLTGAYAEADWAWHNAICNGGNVAHQWRTLTKDEWDYLFNIRTDASSKYGIGNISGVPGMIILPDRWTLPSGCTFTSGLAPEECYYDWTLNNYTLAQWLLMEAAGAVFLPAAGFRYGNPTLGISHAHINDPNYMYDGWYRSSGPYYDQEFVYIAYFSCEMLWTPSPADRNFGLSVRPVQDN